MPLSRIYFCRDGERPNNVSDSADVHVLHSSVVWFSRVFFLGVVCSIGSWSCTRTSWLDFFIFHIQFPKFKYSFPIWTDGLQFVVRTTWWPLFFRKRQEEYSCCMRLLCHDATGGLNADAMHIFLTNKKKTVKHFTLRKLLCLFFGYIACIPRLLELIINYFVARTVTVGLRPYQWRC